MRILLAVALIGLGACGDPTAPNIEPLSSHSADAPVTGKWIAAQLNILEKVTLDLVEDSTHKLTGTWKGRLIGCIPYPDPYVRTDWQIVNCDTSGVILSGSRSGDSVTVAMGASAVGHGRYDLVLVRTSATTMAGRITNTPAPPVTIKRQ